MTRERPDWPTLNAYVDGELDARMAGAVAEAAGSDATVADRITCLYQLKGVMRAVPPSAPDDLGDLLPKTRRRPVAGIIAAAAVVVLVIGVAVFQALSPAPELSARLPEQAVAAAGTLHRAWLATDNGPNGEAPPSLVLAAMSQFNQPPVIPDLTSSKLTIERVTVTDQSEGHVLQVGYRGNHGCHLSLFIFANGKLPSRMVQEDSGAERAYGWQVADLGYMLFAIGMDSARYDLIAHKVEEATRNGAPFDEKTRQALAESKAKSASCAV